MRKVFVDTAAWIALLNIDDELHKQAQDVIGRLRQHRAHLVTTEFVLLEVADALSTPSIRSQTVAFIEGLRDTSLLVSVQPLPIKASERQVQRIKLL